MKKHNERGAGRKNKFAVPTKKKVIPICVESQVDEICKPFLTKKL